MPELEETLAKFPEIKMKVGVITFAYDAKWHIGPTLCDLQDFVWTELKADGYTATAKAIHLLCDALDIEKMSRKAVPPVCVLLSDGDYTDTEEEYEEAIARLNGIPWGKKAVRIAIAIGDEGHCSEDKLLPFTNAKSENGSLGVLRAHNVSELIHYIKCASVAASVASSTKTDLHSLATLLFYLWMCHHPLHGNLESNIRSWDIPAKRRIYGENPVFIFDPNDKSNRPDDPDYETVKSLWALCPQKLKDLFTKAFTEGLRNPGNRVTEGEWQRAFLQLKENNLRCPHCNTENNLWTQDAGELLCWKCKKKIFVPGYLAIGTNFYLALMPEVKLKASHLNPDWNSGEILGEMVENPNSPGNWGIRNHTQDTWKITLADGEVKDVPPGRAAPLSDKLSFTVKGVSIKIVSS